MAIENFVGMLTSFVVGVVSGIAGYRYLATRNLLPAIQMANKIPKKILKEDMKMVIAVRTDLDMGKGKIAAQCCHASVGCYKQAAKKFPQYLETWEYQGQRKIVVKVDGGEEGLEELANAARLRGLPAKIIHDAGRTQIASGTATVVGVGPGPENLVTEVTGHLKLF